MPSALSRTVVAAVCGFVATRVSAPSTALAVAPPGVERRLVDAVVVEGDRTCFDAEQLAHGISEWLRRTSVESRLTVVVRDEPGPPRTTTFRLLRDDTVVAERRFAPAPRSCRDRRALVSIAVALAIELMLNDFSPTASPSSSSSEPREILRPRQPDVQAQPTPGVSVSVLLTSFAGVVPNATAWGASPAVELDWGGPFDARVGAVASFPTPVAFAGGAAVASLIAGRLDACFGLGPGTVLARACLGVGAGTIRAHGRGYAIPRATTLPWVALSGRLAARFEFLGPVALEAGLDGYLPVVRPRLETANQGGTVVTASSPEVWGVAFGFGPVLTFR